MSSRCQGPATARGYTRAGRERDSRSGPGSSTGPLRVGGERCGSGWARRPSGGLRVQSGGLLDRCGRLLAWRGVVVGTELGDPVPPADPFLDVVVNAVAARAALQA